MRAYDIIRKKRDGQELTSVELEFLLSGYLKGTIPEYQISAFLMAVFHNGMTDAETSALTKIMLHSGIVVDLSGIAGVKADKHSTGGVGDKISLILAPLVAAAGVKVPMISGRGLGHTGGTLDKLESIPGFRTNLNLKEYKEVLAKTGCVLIGQTEEIDPLDKRLYALRDVTATVECIPLIASSIMSKKLAEGIDALVLDVKTGSGAFMKTPEDSKKLAKVLVSIGSKMGKKVAALITDMNQPLGNLIGNSLEVEESIMTLRNQGPEDITELTLILSAYMLKLAGKVKNIDEGKAKLLKLLENGAALKKFGEIIEAQGGDPRVIEDLKILPQVLYSEDVLSQKEGYVETINTEQIGISAMVLGAGREKASDKIDPSVGIRIHKKIGDKVLKKEKIATLYFNDKSKFKNAAEILSKSYNLNKVKVSKPKLIKACYEK